jgi:diamine N-acetyltransferase
MTNPLDNRRIAPFLNGEQVYLRPLEREDLAQLQVWENDAEIRGLTGEVTPSNFAAMEDYFERVRKDPSRIWFVIVVKEDERMIGEAGLLRIFPPWRTTDLSIIIGDRGAWGKGHGLETINLLLDYAFGYLNFHRVAIGVVGTNERALRFYEKVGFKQEGIQRDGYFYNHAYQDFVMMSILEDEFRERPPSSTHPTT